MEVPQPDGLDSFEWDEGNRKKIEKRMSVEVVESAFLGEPRIFFDKKNSEKEPRWILMNQVAKRNVCLVFTTRRDKIRALSARYMHGKEARKYGKKIG